MPWSKRNTFFGTRLNKLTPMETLSPKRSQKLMESPFFNMDNYNNSYFHQPILEPIR